MNTTNWNIIPRDGSLIEVEPFLDDTIAAATREPDDTRNELDVAVLLNKRRIAIHAAIDAGQLTPRDRWGDRKNLRRRENFAPFDGVFFDREEFMRFAREAWRVSEASLSETRDEQPSGLLRREQQIRAIEAAAVALGYERTAIPYGGKRKLWEHCKAHHVRLFASYEQFRRAWVEASKANRIVVVGRDKYAGRSHKYAGNSTPAPS